MWRKKTPMVRVARYTLNEKNGLVVFFDPNHKFNTTKYTLYKNYVPLTDHNFYITGNFSLYSWKT